MAGVEINDNTDAVLAELKRCKEAALTKIGQRAESYAKMLCPSRDGALKNSIAFVVEGDRVIVGSNAQYAPYVELGTGNLYQPPPEWVQFQAERGRGLARWIYFDFHDNQFHVGLPQKPHPYIRPALEEHRDEYKKIVEDDVGKEMTIRFGK